MSLESIIQNKNDISTDLSQHAREVKSLGTAYSHKENKRVPITFACDEQLWLKISGYTFREFYTTPEVHLKAQLEGKHWFCQNIIGDMIPGPPEQWSVSVQLWMEENEFFGCDVIYQEDDYAWAKPLALDKESLLRFLSDIHPEERVRQSSTFKMYQALKELSNGMAFVEKPVEVIRPGGSTHGIFTKAAEIRGLGQICLDMHDDPDFVERLLHLVTEKTIGRIKAWHKLTTGSDLQMPSDGGFHFCDDSLQLLSAKTYKRFILPGHEHLYSAMTKGKRSIHLCGRASQHYNVLRHKLNVTAIDGPGPFVDHGRYFQEFGADFSFRAQTDHSILAYGSETEINSMMQQLLQPEAKVPGRFQIMGFITRDTPIHNVQICYQAGREYGII
ncbi:hypothetical protein H8E77_33365 [bacterium]|nr:hypothetical protein [bacterium]